MTQEIKISKYLSYLLRHGAKEKNLQMSIDGFVEVNSILNLTQSKSYKINLEIIKKIVETNDKKRFELKVEDGNFYIRACQGHSIKDLDETKMMREITNPDEFPTVVHGTYCKNWKLIKLEGLKVMNRNHIHFAPGYPKDDQVISGMRSSCDIYIELDLKMALSDGIKFFISSNRVILSSGVNGVILPKYFKNVK
jgi:2'-phosphotransferase